MSRRVVVLVDNYFDQEITKEFLKHNFPEFTTQYFTAEIEFREAFPGLIAEPPDIFLLDVRVRWCWAEENMTPPPPEWHNGQGPKAGFRCWKMVREVDSLKAVPVILRSSIDERHNAEPQMLTDPRTAFTANHSDEDLFVETMRQLL